MADESDKVEPSAPTCLADPNFAVICSFLDKFSISMGISILPFTQLQEMLEEQDQVHPTLVDLHVKLLRKARKCFTVDKWEKTLTRFAHSYSQQDGWELERFGYKKASLGVKIRLLKILLETQFDLNVRFKNEINKLPPQDLRIEPLGKDENGFLYWCQFDPTCNVRVYKEDTDEETWDLVASDRNGLVTLIDSLSHGEGQHELESILNAENVSLEAGKTTINAEGGEEEGDAEGEEEEEDEDNEEEEDEEEDDGEDDESADKEDCKESEINENGPSDDPNIDKLDPAENSEADISNVSNSSILPKIEEDVQPEPVIGKEHVDVLDVAPEPITTVTKTDEEVKDKTSPNEYKETVTTNGSIDLCVNKSLPTRTPPPPRPGSKLEEIFKMKIERSMCPYPDDRTSILSQMAASFNSPNTEAEDLTVSAAKKPRIEKEHSELKTSTEKNTKEENVVGEAIEEKVMVVQGEGSGAECEAGNPLFTHTTSANSPLEFVAVLNGSTKESITEALKNCIIKDSSRASDLMEEKKIPPDINKLAKCSYAGVEKNLFDQIKRINCSTTYNKRPSEEQQPTCSKSENFVFEASEEIVEDVMYFSGCGAGHECETGNSGEPTVNKPSTSDDNVDVEKKSAKKLWSIDTICSTTNKNSESESKIANGPSLEKTTNDNVIKTDNSVVISDSSKSVDECKPKSDSSKSVKTEDKGKKSVLLSNIIEVCLNNNSSVKDNCNKEIPSGSKYQDLFSAKNILGPSDNSSITCNSSGKNSTNTKNKTDEKLLENKMNKVVEGVSDLVKSDENGKSKDSDDKPSEIKEGTINVEDKAPEVHVEKNDDVIEAKKNADGDVTNVEEIENLRDSDAKSESPLQEEPPQTIEKPENDFKIIEEKSVNQNLKDSILKETEEKNTDIPVQEKKKPKTDVSNYSVVDKLDVNTKAEKDIDNKDSDLTNSKELVQTKNNNENTVTEKTKRTKAKKPQATIHSALKPLDVVVKSEIKESSDIVKSDSKIVESTETPKKSSSDIDETQKGVESLVNSDNELIKIVADDSKDPDSNQTKKSNNPTVVRTNSDGSGITSVSPSDKEIDKPKGTADEKSLEPHDKIDDCEKSVDDKVNDVKAQDPVKTEIVETNASKNSENSINKPTTNSTLKLEPSEELQEDVESVIKEEIPKVDVKNKKSIVPIKSEVYVRMTRMKSEVKAEDTFKDKCEDEESSTVKQISDEPASRRSTRRSSASKPSLPVKTPKGKKQTEKVISEESTLLKGADSKQEGEETKENPRTAKPVKDEDANDVTPAKVGDKRKRNAQQVDKSEKESKNVDDESNCQSVENEVECKATKVPNRGKRYGRRSRKRPGNAKNLRISGVKKEDDSKVSKKDEETNDDVVEENVKIEAKSDSSKTVEHDESEDDVPLAKRGRKITTEPKSEKNEQTIVKKRRCPKRPTVLGLTETDLKSVQVVPTDDNGGGSMRASRRIAMQKIKEEADRRAVEDAIQDIDKSKRKKGKEKTGNKKEKSRGKQQKGKTDSEDDLECQDEVKKDGKRKKKNRSGFKYNINKPWASSSDDEDENLEEEEEDHLEFMGMDDDDEPVGKVVSDHEFSCDEDLEKGEGEILPVRRARTAVIKKKGEDISEEEELPADVEDYKCEKCNLGDHPEWILLCDTCDKGYHASCLRPPLMLIPEGDWHCPVCQHAALVLKLKQVLRTFEQHTKRRDNEELRRKRLAYVGISLANVLPETAGGKIKKPEKNRATSGSSGEDSSSEDDSDSDSSEGSNDDEPVYQLRQRRSAVQSYRFNDYDQLIDSAIQDEMVTDGSVVLHPVNVDIEPVRFAENGEAMEPANEMDGGMVNQENEENDDDESKTQWLPPVAFSKSQVPFGRKKPKKLCNLDVESDDQNDSDEDFKGSSSDEEEDDYSNASDESGDFRRNRQPLRRSGRARHSRVDKDFINDGSDESYSPRKKKKKQVWDESDSSSDSSWGRRKKRATVRSSYSKSQSKSKKKKKSRSHYESDSDVPKKKPRAKKPKVRYGMSEDDEDGPLIRTRGKKMNYTEIHGSDTEEEERINRIKGRKTLSDMEAEDEEFVLDQDEEEEFMKGKGPVKKGGPRRISSDEESEIATENKEKEEKVVETESKEGSDEGELEEETKVSVVSKSSDIPKPEVRTPSVEPSSEEPSAIVEAPIVRPKIVPIATQRLLAPRPPPTRLPYTSLRRPATESDEEDMEDEEEEELEEEEMMPEDEMFDEDEGKSDEEQYPPRKIPPPIPSLRLATPARPSSVGLNAIQSKLKEALNASNERKPRESEALAKLREKLAAAASRPNPAISISPVIKSASNAPSKLAASTASKVLPFPSSPTKSEVIKTEEKDKQASPAPVINSIRVVNTQKLLAHPQHQPELLKRNRPDVPSVIRGMLSPGQPPGSSLFYNRGAHQRLVCPPGMDPARFMQQRHPLLHPPPHLQQQRRFPDRYLYGPGAVYHPGVGGFYPTPPGPTPAAAYQHADVTTSEFRESSSPADEELHYQNPGPASGPQPPSAQPAPGSDGRGEFGGLVSYFSSQREEDGELET